MAAPDLSQRKSFSQRIDGPIKWIGLGFAVATFLYGVFSKYQAEQLFRAQVSADLLEIAPARAQAQAAIEVQNSSDQLLGNIVVSLGVEEQPGHIKWISQKAGAITPNNRQTSIVSFAVPHVSLGSRFLICVRGDGQMPFVGGIWKKIYRYSAFVPPADGKRICKYGMADIMRYNTMPPEMLDEVNSGCVLPDVANPRVDYVQADTTLKEESHEDQLSIAGTGSCAP